MARLFAYAIAKTVLQAIVFTVPVAFVAYLCDVEPTWKLLAFILFFGFWSECVFEVKGDWSALWARWRDPAAFDRPPASAVVMTPAQVAEAARRLTPRPGR